MLGQCTHACSVYKNIQSRNFTFVTRVLFAESPIDNWFKLLYCSFIFKLFPQQLGVATAWHGTNLSLFSLPNAKATWSKLLPTRYRDPLNTAAMLLFSWPYIWRNSTTITDVWFFQSYNEHNGHSLPIQPIGCGRRDFHTSVICRRLSASLTDNCIISCINEKIFKKYIHKVNRLLVI